MFNPNDFDEVCVHAIHIESSSRPFKFSQKLTRQLEMKDSKDSTKKGNLKGKITTIAQKEGEKPTCTHCQRIRHDESKCWKIHPELKPKNFLKKSGEKKANTVIQ